MIINNSLHIYKWGEMLAWIGMDDKHAPFYN